MMWSDDLSNYDNLVDDQMLLCCACKKLLNDPLQLQCLHNCCRHCLDVGTADDVGPFVKCPACSQLTYTATASSNALIDLKVRHFKTCMNARTCGLCSDSDSSRVAAAMVWCRACAKSFCADCMLWHSACHKDHITVAVEDVLEFSEAVPMPALSCSLHGKTYEFVCLTCATIKCIDCWSTCNKLKHDMMLVSDDSMPARAAKVKEELAGLERDLQSNAGPLSKHLNLPDELRAARAEHLQEVRRRKKVIMDAVDRACIAAEEMVKDIYDTLDEKAFEMKAAAMQLDHRARQVVDYCHYVVDSNVACALLHQQKQLLSGLTSLVKELEAIQSPVDAAVVIIGSMPADLEQQVSAWIGTPTLARDDLWCSAGELESLSTTAATHAENDEVLPSGPSRQLDAEDGELRLGTASSSFTTAAACMDMAVTADGHLLLAAGRRGMLECDDSGRQLSSWTPAKTKKKNRGGEDLVWTVDELQDGRVAVGLSGTYTVQLLRRSAAARDSWQQELVIRLLGMPRRLSVHALLMAVAEGSLAEGCQQLVFVSLTDGRELLRLTPGYCVYSVAATADAVIASSAEQVQVSHGRVQHIVDSYSHSGQLLWRQSFDEQVYDLHWVQALSVVYLALQDSDKVTAIRAVDGQQLSEVLSSSHGLKKPWMLSASRGQRAVLAVLHGDVNTVTVYPVLGSSGSK